MKTTREAHIPAARFKARCLKMLDQVAQTGRSIVVTKRGRPVARVVPLEAGAPDLRGSVLEQGDLVSPVDDAWESEA